MGHPAVMLLATLVVLAPWTIRNAVALDRFVPVSTGGGKALYIGTYLEADGDGPKLRDRLLARYLGLAARSSARARRRPDSYALERVLARVAPTNIRTWTLTPRSAELGRENLRDDITDQPIRFAGLSATRPTKRGPAGPGGDG